ncbi:MAG: class I SAM-dependent methyltransferase, partial [Ktedonobacteraceae bacterium]
MSRLQDTETQEQVDAFFRDTAAYWKTIYDSEDGQPLIYSIRQNTTLKWVEELAPGPDFRVLDIGCGAGMLSIALAARGLQVHAIDPVEEMLGLARQGAVEAGVADRLTLGIGDIYALDAEDASFDLVIALGVFPYLDRPEAAVREMTRVTKPGGHLIFSTHNQLALIGWLDPLCNPFFRSLWLPVKSALLRRGIRISNPWPDAMARSGNPWPDMMPGNPSLIDKLLVRSTLIKVRGITLGFYPFTFLSHTLLPKSLGLWLNHQLQRL